jgi:uncharacterized membrane protein YdbT with pleckstrin-like domain
MSWRGTVLHLLRVPPDPEPPPGSPPRVFRAAPNFFKLRLLEWSLKQVFGVGGLVVAFFFFSHFAEPHLPRPVVWLLAVVEIIAVATLLFQAVLGWTIVHLDYELRWYMLSDRAIRIREGIISVREKTIALANIQNISIRQGPLQRLLGIADVEVKTAGGGGGGSDLEQKKHHAEPMHVAYFRGVDNAAQIRDLVREGVRQQRNAGLGDPEDHHSVPAITPPQDTATAAGAELLAEARALRLAVSSSATE